MVSGEFLKKVFQLISTTNGVIGKTKLGNIQSAISEA